MLLLPLLLLRFLLFSASLASYFDFCCCCFCAHREREIVCNFVAISSFTAAAAAAVAVAKLFLQYFLIKPGPVSQSVSQFSQLDDSFALLFVSFCCCSIRLRNVSSRVFSLSLSQAVVSVMHSHLLNQLRKFIYHFSALFHFFQLFLTQPQKRAAHHNWN